MKHPPRDGVTTARFSGDGRSLIVSSWDSSLRAYDVEENAVISQSVQPCPLLDCDFLTNQQNAVSAGLDGAVRVHGLHSGEEKVLGTHRAAVRCVRNCEAVHALASGSWDHDVKLWDVRSHDPCIGTYQQPGKVLCFCAGASDISTGSGGIPLLVVATTGR